MKIENIALGDSVQVKKSLCHSEFKAKQVCEVIDIDHTDKHGFDVLIQGKNCLDWVNHKHLKKPEPQLKQLDQSVFNGLDEKWRFAMVSSVGIPFVYDYKPTGKRHFLSDSAAQLMVNIGKVMRIDEYDYDTSNWQNSLIERDIAKELLEVDLSSELTGSELCRAMLARGDKCVLIRMGVRDDKQAKDIGRFAIATSIDESGRFNVMSDQQPIGKVDFAVPINNQGEPLTASEVGL